MKGNKYIPFMLRRGDGSTLSLDFTAMGSLDSRFTFTRSTTATYINSSGYVESIGAAASNDPTKARFDYDPTTLTARGLLIEGSSTNELTNNETFGTGWTDSNITRDSTNNTSPRNDATALRATASSANATIIRSAAIGTSAQRTFSVWLRRVSGTGNIQFTTNNGTAWTTQAITSSWVRYTFTATTEAQRVGFRIVTSGDSIELWGAQLESGSGASSYIPTGASTVQRAADICYMDTAAVNSWFVKNNEATFQVRYSCDNALSIGANVFFLGQWSGGEYSYGYQHYTYAGSGGTMGGNGKLVSATSADNALYSNQSLPRVFNAAFSFSTSASLIANSWNGNTPTQLAATSWPAWPGTTVRLGIGTNAASGTASTAVFVRIKAIKYWPTRLSNATLQSITA